MVKKGNSTIKITKKESIHQIYDKILKNLFSIKYIMELFIKNFLKERWIKSLDLTTLELLPNDFVSKDLDNYYSDLIYKVNYKNEEIYIIILIEFQSTINRFMSFRMLNYIMNFYSKYIKQNEKAESLPFVFPILFYTGSADWEFSNRFENLVETKDKKMLEYVPKFRYFEFFLNKLDRNKIVKAKNLLNQVIAMDLSRSLEESKDTLQKIVDELINLVIEPEVKEEITKSVGLYLKYLSKNIKIDNKIINEIFSLNGGGGMLAEKMQKWIEELREESIEKGKEEGIKEGEKKKAVEIAKELILSGTDLVFVAKITQISIDEIRKLKEDMSL